MSLARWALSNLIGPAECDRQFSWSPSPSKCFYGLFPRCICKQSQRIWETFHLTGPVTGLLAVEVFVNVKSWLLQLWFTKISLSCFHLNANVSHVLWTEISVFICDCENTFLTKLDRCNSMKFRSDFRGIVIKRNTSIWCVTYIFIKRNADIFKCDLKIPATLPVFRHFSCI